jgi:ABC-type amino acid transport substrate-binding protein
VAFSLKGFFSRDGMVPPDITTNNSLVYVPDRLKDVDLYIGPITSLPWRERLMTVVALYPMQNFLAGKKGQELYSLNQLSGKRVAVIKDAMQESLLRELAVREGLKIHFVYIDPKDDLIDAVARGQADYTLDGQLFFAQNRFKMTGLSLSRFETRPVRVGWAMKKTDRVLASLVNKYFAMVQQDGTFSKIFETNYGTTFSDYMDVLGKALSLGESP